MKEFSKFLVENRDVISIVISIIFLIVSFILSHFFKVKVNVPVTSYASIVDYIKEAEDIFGSGNGEKKLEYVVKKYLKANNISKIFESAVRGFVEEIVEDVLETPEKHGKEKD